jgi:hypothetical protein
VGIEHGNHSRSLPQFAFDRQFHDPSLRERVSIINSVNLVHLHEVPRTIEAVEAIFAHNTHPREGVLVRHLETAITDAGQLMWFHDLNQPTRS